jgi:hypothetical protein
VPETDADASAGIGSDFKLTALFTAMSDLTLGRGVYFCRFIFLYLAS